MDKLLFLDLETTGLDSKTDEILEIGIVSESGDILFNSLIKPVRNKTWEEAQKIHGITPKHVESSPTFNDVLPDVLDILADNTVIIYNADYDSRFLNNAVIEWLTCRFESEYGRSKELMTNVLSTMYSNHPGFLISALWNIEFRCAMLAFAEAYGDWNEYFESFTWKRLSFALSYIPKKYRDGVFTDGTDIFSLLPTRSNGKNLTSHSAIFDCFACRSVWLWLMEEE